MTFVPALRFIPPFRGAYLRVLEVVKVILGVLEKIINEHKEGFDEENIRDVIDEFLKHMKHKEHDSFHDRQLLQFIRDLFVAGSETTSSTLRWSFLCLALYPHFQEKLFKEITNVIGESGTPSMNHRDKMPYMRAFIHEIMRHRTLVIVAIPHRTTENVSLAGYRIPKNTAVVPNIWAVHNNPEYFVNPSKFEPERFLDEEGKFVTDPHVIPFSIGPRYCLGEQLARMEIFLFLTSIVQKFHIVADKEKPLPSLDGGCMLGLLESPHQFYVSFNQR